MLGFAPLVLNCISLHHLGRGGGFYSIVLRGEIILGHSDQTPKCEVYLANWLRNTGLDIQKPTLFPSSLMSMLCVVSSISAFYNVTVTPIKDICTSTVFVIREKMLKTFCLMSEKRSETENK